MKLKLLPIIAVSTFCGLISCSDKNNSADEQGKSEFIREDMPNYSLGALFAHGHNLTEEIKVPSATDPEIQNYPGGIVLTKIDETSPLTKAGLKTGDIIYGVGETNLKVEDNPTLDLIRHVESSHAKGEGPIKLNYYRAGKAHQADVTLTQASIDLVKDNKLTRLQELTDKACDYLASQQQSDGSFSASTVDQNVIVTSAAGLAFLSNQNTFEKGKQAEALKKCYEYVSGQTKESTKLNALSSSYAILFFTELAGSECAREKSLPALRDHLVGLLAENGLWDSDSEGTNSMSSHITNYALLALGAAERVGLRPIDETLTAKVFTKINELHGTESLENNKSLEAGRSAALSTALNVYNCPKEDRQYQSLVDYAKRNLAKVMHSPSCRPQFIFSSALLAYQGSSNEWQTFLHEYKYLLVSLQQADGSLADFPTANDQPQAFEKDLPISIWNTANFAIACGLQNNSLSVTTCRNTVNPMFQVCDTNGKRASMLSSKAQFGGSFGGKMPEGAQVIEISDPAQIEALMKSMGGGGNIQMQKIGPDGKPIEGKGSDMNMEELRKILGDGMLKNITPVPAPKPDSSKPVPTPDPKEAPKSEDKKTK